MGLTENLSPTFLSTGNHCLDFFFQVVPDTPTEDLIRRLQLAWAQDALITLKLIFNLRGVRGTGKSDKQGFYNSALWLHKAHPKTLVRNIGALADFGYLKDLPEILYRLLERPEVRKLAKQARGMKMFSRKRKANSRKFKRRPGLPRLQRLCIGITTIRIIGFSSIVFAELLKLDLAFLGSGEVRKISLAGKWCPTIDSSYDRSLLICEGIARRVFPRECEKEYEEIEEVHYAYRVRDRLQKQVLGPLHKALQLPEVYMSANEWNALPYNRVASVAMKTYQGLFTKHDRERFGEYLEQVKSGKAKIAAGALLPHEIIQSLNDGDGGKVAELQWERMVGDVAKKGKLKNCIAVCDVSGSMDGTPMEVCVALGLLVSELSEEPWKGKVITFSENPQLHLIKGETLLAKTEFIRRMEWGGSTDFQKVFDQILNVAVEGKLTEDQLIKRVFVFSDMEFDQASHDYASRRGGLENTWETDYEVIQRKFREKRYNRCRKLCFGTIGTRGRLQCLRFRVGWRL
ncbi:hypothetical protein FH972_025770 [Carpinus fangiana]|nr:hypothetical protein FH972_025770 [Carpinus fangiana]